MKKADYKDYPATKPEGFAAFHESTIGPIVYEIPFGSKVLDVGSNDGALMQLLKEKRHCDVSGIDPAEEPTRIAKEKGLNVVLGRGEELPFPDASFDVVTLIETYTHLEFPDKVLAEIKRVLKPDGMFIGSLPHKNMETFIWSDKRLHKRYIDDVQLQDELEAVFEMVHMRVLKASQFALAWAQSAFADLPAEMLFKAGGRNTAPWESAYKEDGKLRVWFGYTQLAGTVYYRMTGFAEKMDESGLIEAAYERDTWPNMEEKAMRWQNAMAVKVLCGSNHCESGYHYGNRIVVNHLEQILRVSDMSIWQIVNNRGALAFLRCAKDLADGPWYRASGKHKAFITEMDDFIFDIPGYNIASHPYHANSEMEWVALEQIKLSDAVIVSTQFLADKLKLITDKPVFVVPNSLDFKVWDNLNPGKDFPAKEPGQIRIGYTGCSNHLGDLQMVREPMEAILKEFSNVQFVMTPQPTPEGQWLGWPGVPNVGVVQKWEYIDKYPNFIAGWGMDIGIAPLLDSNFNRAKSNLRWLEYSALKLPTVASRVYPFKNSIRNGEDGFICNSSQEWYDALKQLITDESRRREVGQTAYARVKRDFNMDNVANHYAQILEEIRCNVPIWKQKSPDSSEIPAIPAGPQPSLMPV